MTTTFKVQQRGDDSVAPDLPVTEQTGSFAVAASDIGKEFQVNAVAAATADLPSVSGVENGFNVLIRNSGANDVTLDPAASEQIDGQSSVTLGQDDWRWIRNDGVSWRSISSAAAMAGGSIKKVSFETASMQALVASGNTADVVSADITVGDGSDVMILAFLGNSNRRTQGTNAWGNISVFRDTTLVSTFTTEFLRGFGNDVFNTYSALAKDTNPGSGSYTYTLRFETTGTGGDIAVGDAGSPHGIVVAEVAL